jgi:hypothetical protein
MKSLLLVLALGVALPVLAQTQVKRAQVYRCGPDGRDLRDSPCPGGNAASGVDYDQPSSADSRATRDRQMADAKQAAALAAARRASDAEARHQRAQTLGLQAPPPAPASAPQIVRLKPPKVARPHKPTTAASAAR